MNAIATGDLLRQIESQNAQTEAGHYEGLAAGLRYRLGIVEEKLSQCRARLESLTSGTPSAACGDVGSDSESAIVVAVHPS